MITESERLLYKDNHIWQFCGDCRSMYELPDQCVQMVCTSPPYWGLRRYSGEQEIPEWGCSFGLEKTPELYIEHTVEIMREIRRVLRKDGVVFWNIGDSYWGGKGQSGQGSPEYQAGRQDVSLNKPYQHIAGPKQTRPSDGSHYSIKPKDLCLIPFRVAIALQEDGWWVRSVIIWSKKNPMPESVTDRPTESHEYLLMLTQSGKSLYWTHRDSGGTRQKPKPDYRWVNQITQEEVSEAPTDWKIKIKCPQCEATSKVSVYLGLDVWQDKQCDMCHGKKETQLWKRINLWKGHDYYWDADAMREPTSYPEGTVFNPNPDRTWVTKTGQGASATTEWKKDIPRLTPVGGRNIRTVWEFPTQPYPEAHFAVFPEKLPEICIKATTPEVGCCSKCGSPWERIVERTGHINKREVAHVPNNTPTKTDSTGWQPLTRATDKWQPTCKCNADKVPSIVLDNFCGAGTTLWVAKILNRKAVGYEISREYCDLAIERNRQQVFL